MPLLGNRQFLVWLAAIAVPTVFALLMVRSLVGFANANGDGNTLASAPICSSGQSNQALMQALPCVASVAGTVSDTTSGQSRNQITVFYNTDAPPAVIALADSRAWSSVIAQLSQSSQVDVTMTVWQGQVVGVTDGTAEYDTVNSPSQRGVSALIAAMELAIVSALSRFVLVKFGGRWARTTVSVAPPPRSYAEPPPMRTILPRPKPQYPIDAPPLPYQQPPYQASPAPLLPLPPQPQPKQALSPAATTPVPPALPPVAPVAPIPATQYRAPIPPNPPVVNPSSTAQDVSTGIVSMPKYRIPQRPPVTPSRRPNPPNSQ